ncbi:hypothetical protein Tco_1549945 [Tanacetum coccineum]
MTQSEVGSNGWKSTARRAVSASGRWNNVGKESQQNGSVTLGKGLALRAGHGGLSFKPADCRRTARAAYAARACRRVPAVGRNGNGSFGESDCLVKIKHCDGPCSQMPRHLISDAYEWINEIPTVPVYYLAKPQPRERAWQNQRGKKTLLSLTLVRLESQAFIAMLLFDPSMSALPIIVKQNSPSVGLFTHQ